MGQAWGADALQNGLQKVIHKDSGCPSPLPKMVACKNENQFEYDTANSKKRAEADG